MNGNLQNMKNNIFLKIMKTIMNMKAKITHKMNSNNNLNLKLFMRLKIFKNRNNLLKNSIKMKLIMNNNKKTIIMMNNNNKMIIIDNYLLFLNY